tara:strand:+ start:277 stop:639 length:363 start_codon:yes stop_codon:yes gene_type:complete
MKLIKTIFLLTVISLLIILAGCGADTVVVNKCAVEGIQGYPTWKFDDGSALAGPQQFTTLSQKTGCALPDSSTADSLEQFAACLTENGATMYGAEWCGRCKTQKEMFGSAFEKVDYVECG